VTHRWFGGTSQVLVGGCDAGCSVRVGWAAFVVDGRVTRTSVVLVGSGVVSEVLKHEERPCATRG
jgi:hypothetical protein